MEALDPYKAPPKCLKDAYKRFHSLKVIEGTPEIIDFTCCEPKEACVEMPRGHYDEVFSNFLQSAYSGKEAVKRYNTGIPGTRNFYQIVITLLGL
jgi:hypothetical protein